jgi:cell wall-associated NlpC family hydrolase
MDREEVMTESAQRAAVIAEAVSWLKTPFRDCARVKGAGIDCCNLIAAAYEGAGVAEHITISQYSPQLMLHSAEERFIRELTDHGFHEIQESEAQPADVAVFKVGRSFSHGAIVIEPGRKIVHAVKLYRGVVFSSLEQDTFVARRERKLFSFWPINQRSAL